MNTQTILRNLKKEIKIYLLDVKKSIRTDNTTNKLEFKYTYPTDDEFQEFIFKKIQEMGIEAYNDGIIYIVLDGYKMPVITHFYLEDNIYNQGKIECSVWINEYVKEKE
jgi:hypothetical protein